MNEVQKILDETFPFIEKLLKENKEFYPLASAVNNDGVVIQIVEFENNDDDFPLSTELIKNLKNKLVTLKGAIITSAIFYDVRVDIPNTKLKTDAIAVDVETLKDGNSFTIFYPYKFNSNSELEFQDAWKTLKDIEIFTN